MSALVFPNNDDTQIPEGLRCDCGAFIPWPGYGQDYCCDRCPAEYSSGGQRLAPRSQWGEETGETAADYLQGVNDPEGAFDL